MIQDLIRRICHVFPCPTNTSLFELILLYFTLPQILLNNKSSDTSLGTVLASHWESSSKKPERGNANAQEEALAATASGT